MKEPARFQANWRQFKRRCVIYTSLFLLLPITSVLADNITLISSDPVHMTAGVSSDTITVSFTFSAAIDHENMYWDSFMLFPWGPYTTYTLHDRWFSEDGKTAYAVISHIPDTDFVWFIMDLPGVDGGHMKNVHVVNYSTRDELSEHTVSGSLSYQPYDNQKIASDTKSQALADGMQTLSTSTNNHELFWGGTIVTLLDDISWLGEPEGLMGSMPHVVNVGRADPQTGEYLIENVRPGDYYLSAINFEPIKWEDNEPLIGVYGLDLLGSNPVAVTIGDESVAGLNIVLYDSIPDVPLDFDGDIFVESSYPAHMAAGVSTDIITVRFSFNAAIDDENMYWDQFMLFPHMQYTLHNRWFAVNHMTAYVDISHEPDTDYVWRIDDLVGLDGGYMESMQVLNYTTRAATSELTISGQLSLSPKLEDLLAAIDDARHAMLPAEGQSEFTWGMATIALFDDISWFDGPDGLKGSLPNHVNIGKVDPQTGAYLIENVRAGTYYLLAVHLEPVRDADYDPFIAFYGGMEPVAIVVTDESLEDMDIELDTVLDTDAEDPGGTGIPGTISLHQNYPNPFNPVTQIRYDLSSNSDVILEVYDLLGRHIATLADTHMPAGRYYAEFDATTIASGIYLYRLRAGQKTLTRQMTVLR